MQTDDETNGKINKERGLFLEWIYRFGTIPKLWVTENKAGHHSGALASVWSLGRRSGCFPALPCPPPKPTAL